MPGYAPAAIYPLGHPDLATATRLAHGHGGHGVIYTFSEAGLAIMFGAGAPLLGCALIVFALGRTPVPTWVRWSTLIAGLAGVAALAWFPLFLVYLWALALGLWTLIGERRPASEPARPQAQPI
jgi:hypothetical protein